MPAPRRNPVSRAAMEEALTKAKAVREARELAHKRRLRRSKQILYNQRITRWHTGTLRRTGRG